MPRHKRDWEQYNKELINRGNLNFWITKKSLKFWKAKKSKKIGRPFAYSDEAIRAMLIIRFKYKLPLRELQGLFESLAKFIPIPRVPSYTQVCRRMRSLRVESLLLDHKCTDLVLDTTGLKVYGEGEWCAKRYGGRSKWVKLHIAMDPKSGKLVLAEETSENTHDTALLKKALSRCNRRKGIVLIDGIADSKKCYELSQRHNKRLITPPNRRAVIRKEPIYEKRNQAICEIKGLGGDELARSIWGKLTGYSRRVVVESKIAAWKKLLGADLKSRSKERVKIEVKVKAMIYNMMVDGLRMA